MIVKCQKCGHENQHVSIFCRKCGVKLDKDQLETAISNQRKGDSLRRKVRTVRRIIVLIVVIVILYAVFMVFYPSFFHSDKVVLPRKEFSNALVKLHAFELRAQKDYTFNSSEVTALYNRYFILKKLKNNPLSITIDDNNAINFSFARKISKTIPLTLNYTIVGTPFFTTVKGKKTLDFKIDKIKLGNLSLPASLGTYIVPEFKPYYSRKARGALKKVDRIEVDKDKGFLLNLKNRKILNYN